MSEDALRRRTARQLLCRLPYLLADAERAAADALRRGDTDAAEQHRTRGRELAELGATAERLLAESRSNVSSAGRLRTQS